MNGVYILLAVVAAVGVWFLVHWWFLERGRGVMRAMRPADVATGFVTEFFDTLGIGAFAPTTAIFKLQRRMADDEIPGTLNAGHALSTVVEALIFIAIITLDFTTLVTMIAASVVGAWLGAAFIVRSLSLEFLRWLVLVVVIYAAALMLLSARAPVVTQTSASPRPEPLQSRDA